jgi:hypothetical protein
VKDGCENKITEQDGFLLRATNWSANMTNQLDFSLPGREAISLTPFSRTGIVINLIILLIVCGILVLLLMRSGSQPIIMKGVTLSDASQKELALKLEQQGLQDSAAAAWIEYLSIAVQKPDDIARIWFRIGKLFQDTHQYEKALDAYYRSEHFAKVDEISSEIARRIQECLESMGKFAALRDELSFRVNMKNTTADNSNNSARDTVVAEIGAQKITLSDLDHRIEKEIDRQLSLMAPSISDDLKKQQKEALLKELTTTTQRQRMLNQYLAEEILYREARASNLMEDPDIQAEVQNQERAILAQKVIQKAYAELIKITPEDLATYYEAHKEDYQKQQKKFEDVQNEIYSALRIQKEKEAREYVLSQLREKYDVVIHTSSLPMNQKKESGNGPDSGGDNKVP